VRWVCEEQVIYVSGGILEVTPKKVTVLSDTAMRADDIDEAAALAAQKKAEQALKDSTSYFKSPIIDW